MQSVRSGNPITIDGGERDADRDKRSTPRRRAARRPAHPDRYTRELEQRLASIADAVAAVRDGEHEIGAGAANVCDDDARIWSALRSVATHCRELERRVESQVAERRRAEARGRALVHVSELLLRSLEWRNTLPGVARAVVPALGYLCMIEVDRMPVVEPHAFVAHADPAKTALVAKFHERWRSMKGSKASATPWQCHEGCDGPTRGQGPHKSEADEGGRGAMLDMGFTQTGYQVGQPPESWAPRVTFDVRRELASAHGVESEITRLAEALELRGLAWVPILVADTRLGCVMLGFTERRPYHDADIRAAQDLAQRIALGLENARLYDEARAAAQAREDFLSVASHEMRTPLTPLQLQFGRLLKLKADRGDVDPTRLWGILQTCERHVSRLVRLLDHLLDVSQAARGELDISPSIVDLSGVVHDVAERFAPELQRAGITLEVDAEHSVVGYWDPLRIGQVVTNLLSNAIKYGRGKPIRIGLSRCGDRARLRVEDQGIGISVDRIERVFDRFERAVSPSAYPGLGLGLFMVKEIVDAHGGAVEVHSVFGSGSTFIVELPLQEAASEEA